MARKLFRICLFLYLVYIPVQFILNQFEMNKKLSIQIEKFESISDEYFLQNIPFDGRLDQVIRERDSILFQNKIIMGSRWHSHDFFRTGALYFSASWMPDRIYQFMVEFGQGKVGGFFASLFYLIFIVVPAGLYIIGIVLVRYGLRNPNLKSAQ